MNARARAASRQRTETDTFAGPGAYNAGGETVQTSLGRVDAVTVEISDATYDARVTSTSDGQFTYQVYAQDGTGEVADGTDLSAADVTFDATRN